MKSEENSSYEYSAQNHDWDLTLSAAAELIKAGLLIDKQPKAGSLSKGFSYFTGGMVLSFAAIESFSASVALSMSSSDQFPNFDFQKYRNTKRFWDRMQLLMSAASIEIDKSKGLFRDITGMQQWRNLVTHASPYEIEPIEIENTTKAPRKLHAKIRHLDYTGIADAENAKKFYGAATAYIALVKERTGINPCTSVTYKSLGAL